MLVSPSHAARLQAPGTPGHYMVAAVRQGDSAPSSPPASAGKPVEAAPRRSVSNVEFDSEAKRVIVRQIDPATGTVLSQYPNEAQLRIREYVAVAEAARGKFVSEKA